MFPDVSGRFILGQLFVSLSVFALIKSKANGTDAAQIVGAQTYSSS